MIRYLKIKYGWAKTLLNYWLMRLGLAGAWPHALYIEGTNICNAACVFCAYPQMERKKGTMPFGLFRRAVDEFIAAGGREVDLTPIVGDPLLDRDLFDRLKYLKARPKIRRYHFYTNAIRLTAEMAAQLVQHDRLIVYCSFGGFDRETYKRVMGVDKFTEAMAGIRALIDAKIAASSRMKIQVNLRTPAGPLDLTFGIYLKICRHEGIITIERMEAYDSWAGAVKPEDLEAAGLKARPMPEKRGPCHRLITSPVVLADGRVNACACRDVEASLIIGDLKDRSLRDILSGPELHGLIEAHAKGDLPEVCKRCTYYDSVYPSWWLDARKGKETK